MKRQQSLALLVFAVFLVACAKPYRSASSVGPGEMSSPSSADLPPPPTSSLAPAPGPADPVRICTKLNFFNLVWTTLVGVNQRDAMALALNISGSFEGPNGWQNLTNNFDGQGLSYGLLNQCLGQGSLQPLLWQMWTQFPTQMKAELSAQNLTSLVNMVTSWRGGARAASEFSLSDYGLSALDDPSEVQALIGFDPEAQFGAAAVSRNQSSVAWAVQTLYNGAAFKSDWRSQLVRLAQTAGYRSVQTEAAARIHSSALKLFQHFRLRELRSYLFFFDIVVQNGGLPASDVQTLDALFAAHSSMSETAKLNAILTQRLTHVKAIYREDVRLRKSSIINGTGKVHGAQRDYNREFCTNLKATMPI